MAAGHSITSLAHNSQAQNQSALSSPTNSQMPAPSLQEQQLKDRIQILETQMTQRQETYTASPSASTASTAASLRSIKKTEFETIIAQQMQMIAALAESNKASNQWMEQQMALITNLQ